MTEGPRLPERLAHAPHRWNTPDWLYRHGVDDVRPRVGLGRRLAPVARAHPNGPTGRQRSGVDPTPFGSPRGVVHRRGSGICIAHRGRRSGLCHGSSRRQGGLESLGCRLGCRTMESRCRRNLHRFPGTGGAPLHTRGFRGPSLCSILPGQVDLLCSRRWQNAVVGRLHQGFRRDLRGRERQLSGGHAPWQQRVSLGGVRVVVGLGRIHQWRWHGGAGSQDWSGSLEGRP